MSFSPIINSMKNSINLKRYAIFLFFVLIYTSNCYSQSTVFNQDREMSIAMVFKEQPLNKYKQSFKFSVGE